MLRSVADPSRRSLLAISIIATLLGVLTALWIDQTRPSAAQGLESEPAFVTLLNLTPRVLVVNITQDDANVSRSHTVPAQETATFLVDAGPDLLPMTARCSGCRSVNFAIAAGQRLIVLLAGTEQPAILRSDLHVIIEGPARRTGVVRTGPTPGAGRSLLPFDLRPGESARLGLRARGDAIDLNLTCGGCDAQRLRVTNGIDLEIPIR